MTSYAVCADVGRLAVVGYEELVTARAGQRVGLSAGARVVHVAAGRLDTAGMASLRGGPARRGAAGGGY